MELKSTESLQDSPRFVKEMKLMQQLFPVFQGMFFDLKAPILYMWQQIKTSRGRAGLQGWGSC